MSDFCDIDTPVLLDMLSEYTILFSKLFKSYATRNPSQEYLACKNTLQHIIVELDRRNVLKNQPKPKIESHNDDLMIA